MHHIHVITEATMMLNDWKFSVGDRVFQYYTDAFNGQEMREDLVVAGRIWSDEASAKGFEEDENSDIPFEPGANYLCHTADERRIPVWVSEAALLSASAAQVNGMG